LAVGLALASPHPASAQTDRDRAAARSAAEAGADAYDQAHYDRSLELFSRAEQLVHAPPHLLFMARSLVKLGRLVEARETYLKIVNEQLPASAPKAFKTARDQAESEINGVEGRIAYVTITIRGGGAAKAGLSIDHADVSAAEQGIPIPMDPGTHVFSAHTEQTKSDEKTLTLRDGAKESLELTLPEGTPNGAVAGAGAGAAAHPEESPKSTGVPSNTIQPEPTDGSHGGSGRRIVAYTTIGIGVVGVGVGSYFLASSLSSRNKANQIFECDATSSCSPEQKAEIKSHDHDADVARNVSIASFAVGAVGVVTGIVLLVTGNGGDSGRATTGVRELRVSAGPGSLALSGKF
jgi:hypothetical protein